MKTTTTVKDRVVAGLGGPDKENPEWTPDRIKKGLRFHELPPAMQRAFAPATKRGAQVAPKKQAISIRLSPDVLEALRATGPGWQARADAALRSKFVPVSAAK